MARIHDLLRKAALRATTDVVRVPRRLFLEIRRADPTGEVIEYDHSLGCWCVWLSEWTAFRFVEA